MSIYSEKISLRYNKINILENIDIEIKKGEILSILGPNGAGKSSLLNILSGSIVSHEGNVFYDEENINNISLSDNLLIFNHSKKTVDHPSSFVRAVNSETLSVGA